MKLKKYSSEEAAYDDLKFGDLFVILSKSDNEMDIESIELFIKLEKTSRYTVLHSLTIKYKYQHYILTSWVDCWRCEFYRKIEK